MNNDLNFEDIEENIVEDDLHFEDYFTEDFDSAISDISSSLCFELPGNPLTTNISASSKLLAIFEQRYTEIENLLKTTKYSSPTYKDLQLELRMLKTALAQHKGNKSNKNPSSS